MRLRRFRPELGGSGVRLCGFLIVAGLLASDAEVEPIFEIVRHHLDQLAAQLGSSFEIAGGKRGSSQAGQGGLRVRPQRQQFFGIIAHRIVVPARDLERDHIGQRLFGAGIFFQQLAV